MLKGAITGGIGSGKSTACKVFAQLGIPIFYADDAAKKAYQLPEIKEQVLALFGKKAYEANGEVNRKHLSESVFKEPALLKQLNAIIHPAVRKAHNLWHDQQKAPYTLNEAAILFETGGYKAFDFTILVTAPKEKRIHRVMERDQSSEAQVRARMANQWTDAQKKPLASYLLENGTREQFIKQIMNLHQTLRKASENQ